MSFIFCRNACTQKCTERGKIELVDDLKDEDHREISDFNAWISVY